MCWTELICFWKVKAWRFLGCGRQHPPKVSCKSENHVPCCSCRCLLSKNTCWYFFLLERIYQDIRKLEKGVFLNGELTFGTLIAYYNGDNLGLRQIEGFKIGLTATRFCRFCEMELCDTRVCVQKRIQICWDLWRGMRNKCNKLKVLKPRNFKMNIAPDMALTENVYWIVQISMCCQVSVQT